jgi:addiction module RelB/DinJ family antitoxin
MATLTITMDNDLKDEFMAFCKAVGLNASATLTLFAKKVVRDQKIPFEITAAPAPAEGVDATMLAHATNAMDEYSAMFEELAK